MNKAVEIDDCVTAVKTMRDVIPFFPATAEGQTVITAALASVVGTTDQLDWLVMTACNSLKSWQGLAELRGIFCSRFRPADGMTVESGLAGFTAEDAEADYQRRVADETQKKVDGWKKQKRLHGDVAFPAEPLIDTPYLELNVPCPACRSAKWVTFAVPGTFELPAGYLVAKCENGHEIDLALLKSGKLGKLTRPMEPTVDEAQLEQAKKAPMSDEERKRKLADLKAALRQSNPDLVIVDEDGPT